MEILNGNCRAPDKAWRFVKSVGAAAAVILAASHGAQAGSVDANTSTYAGDIGGIELPVGTIAVSSYTAYRHGGAYYDSAGNSQSGNLDAYKAVARVDWVAGKVFDAPLVLSFALNYANPQNAEIGGQSLSGEAALFAPTLYFTLGLIVDPKNERDLGFTNYLVLPFGKYDSNIDVNVTTPHQTVDIMQLTYQEGLGKFSPYLKNFWFDAFGAVAFHSDGDNPVSMGGFGFDKLTQDNTYNISAYIRYNWNPLMFAAVGIEKSWGGEQIAKGGVLGALVGDQSLGKDEYLKGHVQFAMPLSESFQIATDITHDFSRTGSFKEDFTAEIRLMKLFMGQGDLENAPLK